MFYKKFALFQITKTSTKISSCSRTDAGVNAYRFPFQFTVSIDNEVFYIILMKIYIFDSKQKVYNLDILLKALNYHLRHEDIKINEIKEVSLDFNIKRESLEKEYIYKIEAGVGDGILNNPIQQHKLVYSISPALNINDMRTTLNCFVGTHNFINFTSRNQELRRDSYKYFRKINEVYLKDEIVKNFNEQDIQSIMIGFKGSGFLTYQIRYMITALTNVGAGIWHIGKIQEALKVEEEEGKDDKIMKIPAPSKGLFLNNVTFQRFL